MIGVMIGLMFSVVIAGGKRLTVQQVAEILVCCQQTVTTLISQGKLRAINRSTGPGKTRYLVLEDDLLAFENARANVAAKAPSPPKRRRSSVAIYDE